MSERDEKRAVKIYVIQHPHGYVKIGKSVNPQKRLRSLQAASPYELEVLTTIEVKKGSYGDERTVETLLHHFFEEYRHRGEWFQLPQDEIETLRELDVLYQNELILTVTSIGERPNHDPGDGEMRAGLKDFVLCDRRLKKGIMECQNA